MLPASAFLPQTSNQLRVNVWRSTGERIDWWIPFLRSSSLLLHLSLSLSLDLSVCFALSLSRSESKEDGQREETDRGRHRQRQTDSYRDRAYTHMSCVSVASVSSYSFFCDGKRSIIVIEIFLNVAAAVHFLFAISPTPASFPLLRRLFSSAARCHSSGLLLLLLLRSAHAAAAVVDDDCFRSVLLTWRRLFCCCAVGLWILCWRTSSVYRGDRILARRRSLVERFTYVPISLDVLLWANVERVGEANLMTSVHALWLIQLPTVLDQY